MKRTTIKKKMDILTTGKEVLQNEARAVLVAEKNVREEACKSCTTFNLAPTTSTLVELALGDALASALQELKGFKAEHFAAIHPGGHLGKLFN